METKYAKGKYPVYYDETKKVPNLLKQEVSPLKLGRMPALLVVDKEGIIQYAYYGDSMKDIPKNEEIFEALKKLKG
jgi:peroxiredoxin Q/BCP